jgi:hypothetical protein
MKKKYLLLFLGLIIITGCATNNASSNKKSASSSNKTVECIEVGSYDNSDLNNFLQSSYDNCNLLASKVEKLDEINDFVEDPSGWMATEVNKATSPYKQQLKSAAYIASNRDEAMKALKIAFVKRINDEILKELKSALEDANNKLSGSSNALSSAKGLSGMKKLSAAKDVANATKNYKATLALIQELQAQASRLVNNLKV